MVTTRNGLNFSPNYKGSNLKSDLVSHGKRQSKLSDKLKNYKAWLNPKLCGNGEALKACHYFPWTCSTLRSAPLIIAVLTSFLRVISRGGG